MCLVALVGLFVFVACLSVFIHELWVHAGLILLIAGGLIAWRYICKRQPVSMERKSRVSSAELQKRLEEEPEDWND